MYEDIMTPAASDGEAAERFIKLVEYLRAPDGCPWDREQTHKSLIRPMVEETYEAIEAIEKQKELIKQSIAETEILFNSRMDYYFN